MRQSEENFLDMVHSVLETLKKDQSNWSTEPVIVNVVNAIEHDYNRILGNLNFNSRLEPVRDSQSENEDFDAIIRATIKLCRRMYIYARHHNDEIILKLVDHFESTLATGSEKTVIRRCHAILSRADWMHYYLRPYKVNATQLAKLHDLIDDYDQHHGGRSKIKINNLSHKPSVSHQITELKEMLTILDELVNGLITNRIFISEYHNSRIIVDYTQVSKTGSESLLR